MHFQWSGGVNTCLATEISPLYRVTFVQSIADKSVINRGLANAAYYVMQFGYCTLFLQWRVVKEEGGGGLGGRNGKGGESCCGFCALLVLSAQSLSLCN